jgi:hypothetical protein
MLPWQSTESHGRQPAVFVAEFHPLLHPPPILASSCGSASSISLISAIAQVDVLQKYKPAQEKSYERALPDTRQNVSELCTTLRKRRGLNPYEAPPQTMGLVVHKSDRFYAK